MDNANQLSIIFVRALFLEKPDKLADKEAVKRLIQLIDHQNFSRVQRREDNAQKSHQFLGALRLIFQSKYGTLPCFCTMNRFHSVKQLLRIFTLQFFLGIVGEP